MEGGTLPENHRSQNQHILHLGLVRENSVCSNNNARTSLRAEPFSGNKHYYDEQLWKIQRAVRDSDGSPWY